LLRNLCPIFILYLHKACKHPLSIDSRWREILACNDNICGEAKSQNSHGSCGLTGFVADPRLIIWRGLPQTFWQQVFGSTARKNSVAPYYLAEPFASALALPEGPSDFFCHIIWRQRGQRLTGKKGQKGHATLCGRTFCAIVLYLQGLRRNLRHVIWRKSATI
jgi:hypothetical protein